jgi:2-polyprenyl-6-methoxyphenol hydroxylase-like FAD-dependent oxidoreductase
LAEHEVRFLKGSSPSGILLAAPKRYVGAPGKHSEDIVRHGLKVVIVGAGTGGACLAQGLMARNVRAELFERDRSPADPLQRYRPSINADGSRAPRGISDLVHLGKRFTHYEEEPRGQVTAYFDDGSTATADVLVGADGAGSRVRAQLLPQAQRTDSGLVIVTGKLALTDRVLRTTPPEVFRGPTLILGPQGCFLLANAMECDASGAGAQHAAAPDRDDYLMWSFAARRDVYGISPFAEGADGEQLRAAVTELMGDSHPDLRRLVEATEVEAIDAFPARTSVPVPPWKAGNITLVGDALHNMTPLRRVGANTALRDAAALCDCLVAVDRGEQALVPALARYERNMIHYGFDAVRSSLKDMRRLREQSPLRKAVTRTFLRLLNRMAPLKPLTHP